MQSLIQKIRQIFKITKRTNMFIFWISFLSCLLLTFYVWFLVKNSSQERANENFNFRVNEIKVTVERRMVLYELALKGALGLFTSSNMVDSSEFYNYLTTINIPKNLPGIQGIGFTKYIRANELKSHIAEMKSKGYPDYKVWPEGKRDIYTSIIYLAPFDARNKRAFGYDMFSEPVRNKAMIKARDSGLTAVSNKVILVQETGVDIQFGFLMYVPFYSNSPTTVEERRKNILGFVYSPFRVNDLLKGVVGGKLDQLRLRIYDNISEKPDELMFDSENNIENKKHIPKYSKEIILDINGKSWTMSFNSLPAFEDDIDDEKPLFVLFFGLIISGSFFVLAVALAHSKNINQKLEQILGSTGEGIFGLDNEGNCTFINDAATKSLGYFPKEVVNTNLHDLIHFKDIDNSPKHKKDCPIQNALITGDPIRIDDDYFWKKNGIPFPVEYSAFPILENKKIKGAVIAFSDITERKETLKELEKSLQEKTILLKEVHHRVKNNLQIVSSLLNLQSHQIEEEKIKHIFMESQNRISSMALIHEKLYQTKDMNNINFSTYIRELSSNLVRTYSYSTGDITFNMNLDDVYLNIDTSITLGLIVNELVSNSLKHAFPNGRSGVITIDLHKNNSLIELIISDTGVGLPEGFDYKQSKSLGFHLIFNLVEQIEGKIKFFGDSNGTKFEIFFDYQE